MDIVGDLQRRCARAKMGPPIYDFKDLGNDGGGVCKAYVAGKSFTAIYSGSKKRGRRNAASLAMIEVFGVYTAIIVAETNPHLPYVHFVSKAEYLSDHHQSTLLNSVCRILFVGDSGIRPGPRVSVYPTLEAAVRELAY